MSEISVPNNYFQLRGRIWFNQSGQMDLKASLLFSESYVTLMLRSGNTKHCKLSGNLPTAQQATRLLSPPKFVQFPASLVSCSCLCLQTWHLPLMVIIMPDEPGNLLQSCNRGSAAHLAGLIHHALIEGRNSVLDFNYADHKVCRPVLSRSV